MARSETEMLSLLPASLPQEGSLSRMLKTFNAANTPIPSSHSSELPQQMNGTNKPKKTISFDVAVPTDNEKRQLTKSDDSASHSVTPPMNIGSSSLCYSPENTPIPVKKIVGTPHDLRRHISEDEFLKTACKKQNSPTEPDASLSSVNPASQQTVTLEFKKVTVNKSQQQENATTKSESSVAKSSQPVTFSRQIGFKP